MFPGRFEGHRTLIVPIRSKGLEALMPEVADRADPERAFGLFRLTERRIRVHRPN